MLTPRTRGCGKLQRAGSARRVEEQTYGKPMMSLEVTIAIQEMKERRGEERRVDIGDNKETDATNNERGEDERRGWMVDCRGIVVMAMADVNEP